MFVAQLICSDEDCTHEEIAEARTLDELESLLCDCGCGLAIIGWPDWVEGPGAEVISLDSRRPQPSFDRAA